VYTETVKNHIVIKVKDQGSGMSKTVQKKIFEKFYREHTGNIHNVKGHGLGLAYVKNIIDDHQGEVYVESEKGKGSTFYIKLPLI
jgi:two-component system phosphate regulon sensor histidine kinase PhoR